MPHCQGPSHLDENQERGGNMNLGRFAMAALTSATATGMLLVQPASSQAATTDYSTCQYRVTKHVTFTYNKGGGRGTGTGVTYPGMYLNVSTFSIRKHDPNRWGRLYFSNKELFKGDAGIPVHALDYLKCW